MRIYDIKVPQLLHSYANEIIDALRERQFPSDNCERLSKKYCLKTIMDYSMIEVPNDYPIQHENDHNILFVTIIKSKDKFEERLNQVYCPYFWSKIGEADVDKVFYDRFDKIYNIIFQLDYKNPLVSKENF